MISYLRNNKFQLLAANIILMYIVGIIGILTSKNEVDRLYFLSLTPLNLIINSIMLFSFHEKWNITFILSAIFVALTGFLVEVVGVKTGAIFGNYHYGNTLGIKLFDVPILMALNWLLLIYSTANFLLNIKNIYLFSVIGAAIITFLDTLIEPLCAKFHFWFWEGAIPIKNFIAWFLVSFVLFFIFRKANGNLRNRYAVLFMLLQFLFFGILNFVRIFLPTLIY